MKKELIRLVKSKKPNTDKVLMIDGKPWMYFIFKGDKIEIEIADSVYFTAYNDIRKFFIFSLPKNGRRVI